MSSATETSPPQVFALSFTLVALLRADGHLCNVLTHISAGEWRAVEQAIAAILRPRASARGLSNLAQSLLELICDGRGVTGPMMQTFFFRAVEGIAGKREAQRIKNKVMRLRHSMSVAAGRGPTQAQRRNKSADLAAVPLARRIWRAPRAQTAQATDGARP